ncbi:MAG: hypothetical protein Q4E28_05390 [Clostridia bacterium]|nr:hypothetical protein [Clostridia bacterium]
MNILKSNKILIKAMKVLIVLALVLSFLLFFKTNISNSVKAEGGSTEMLRRETVYYPSSSTSTDIATKYQTKPDYHDAASKAPSYPTVDNPNGFLYINPRQHNFANYWDPNLLRVTAHSANPGIAYGKDDLDLYNKDYDITFQFIYTGFGGGDSDPGATWFFTTDLLHSPVGEDDYGAMGVYHKFGLDWDDAHNKNYRFMKNAVAVEIDGFNRTADYGENKKTLDGLTVDKDGKTIPNGNPGAHVAITFPQESSYINQENDGTLPDGSPIPHTFPGEPFYLHHHGLSKLDNPNVSGYEVLTQKRTGTMRIKWKLKDAGQTDSLLDNIYELSYETFFNANHDILLPDQNELAASGSLEMPFWTMPTPENPWPNDVYHTFLYDKNAKDVFYKHDKNYYLDWETAPNPIQLTVNPDYTQTTPDPMADSIPPTEAEIQELIAQKPIRMGVSAATCTGPAIATNHYWGVSFPQTLPYTVNYYLEGTTTPVPNITPNPENSSVVPDTTINIVPPLPQGYELVENQNLTHTVTETNNVFNVYYRQSDLNYTIEYYNNGVKMEPSETDTLPRTGTVPANAPTVTNVPITNCPEGSGVASYQFPLNTKVSAPSATNPYTITAENNIIRVDYKTAIVENPEDPIKNDEDYLILNFDANDLNNGEASEIIRGRLDSKTDDTIKEKEILTYAVLKGTLWTDVVSKAATPKVNVQDGQYIFNAPVNAAYNKNQWSTDRNAGTGTFTLPDPTANVKVDSLYTGTDREITYYAIYTENVPVGLKKGINSLFIILTVSLVIFALLRYF